MHFARKRFGQHFLTDKFVIDNIVALINPKSAEHIVEIGPGLGALTKPLIAKVDTMYAIELDRDVVPKLKQNLGNSITKLTLFQEDVLQFNFAQFEFPIRVVGNLPYNISTPIFFHLVKYAKNIIDMIFMLQQEVVERLAAKVNTKLYGRLSIMAQYHCDITAHFVVDKDAFSPPPKVLSQLVRLVPYQQKPVTADNYEHFANLVKTAFNHRRKTLRNIFKKDVSDLIWAHINIDPIARPENLTVRNYVELSNILCAQSAHGK